MLLLVSLFEGVRGSGVSSARAVVGVEVGAPPWSGAESAWRRCQAGLGFWNQGFREPPRALRGLPGQRPFRRSWREGWVVCRRAGGRRAHGGGAFEAAKCSRKLRYGSSVRASFARSRFTSQRLLTCFRLSGATILQAKHPRTLGKLGHNTTVIGIVVT